MEIPRVRSISGLCHFVLGCVLLTGPVLAQQAQPGTSSSQDIQTTPGWDARFPCKPISLEPATQLTFRERACWYGDRLIAHSTILHGAFMAAFGDVRNSPHLEDDGWGDFGHRFAVFYARRTGQSAAELIAGYLNHEDPRPHTSGQHGIWNRTRSALLSVMVVQDAEGDRRPALAPIAGAFGSGMVSVPCYRERNSMEDGLGRTGLTYGAYFGSAVFREFQPDLSGLASRLFRKKKQD